MSFMRFHAAVRRLAALPGEQEEYVRRLGTAPSLEELALEFDDDFECERVQLSDGARNAADALGDYLSGISGTANAHLWSIRALHQAAEWIHVRELAAEVLHRMEELKDENGRLLPAQGPLCDHCGLHIPQFHQLTVDNERRVRALIRANRPLMAMAELEEAVGCPPMWAKIWVEHLGAPIATKPGPHCRFCGHVLTTSLAKQCLECGMDWHDPDSPRKLGEE
jgi:hypothetical protein